jgi:hypothetical protein
MDANRGCRVRALRLQLFQQPVHRQHLENDRRLESLWSLDLPLSLNTACWVMLLQ